MPQRQPPSRAARAEPDRTKFADVGCSSEEGARFPISMISSGVWAGEIPLQRAHGLQEVSGGTATMGSELERIGYRGSTPASHEAIPLAAHFELHIEQGPILERERRKIGVVKGVQAYRWFTVDVTGRGRFERTYMLRAAEC